MLQHFLLFRIVGPAAAEGLVEVGPLRMSAFCGDSRVNSSIVFSVLKFNGEFQAEGVQDRQQCTEFRITLSALDCDERVDSDIRESGYFFLPDLECLPSVPDGFTYFFCIHCVL